jgi:hypothetical protein
LRRIEQKHDRASFEAADFAGLAGVFSGHTKDLMWPLKPGAAPGVNVRIRGAAVADAQHFERHADAAAIEIPQSGQKIQGLV